MRLLLALCLLQTNILIGQEIKYNLIIQDPCTNQFDYGLLYQLEKAGRQYIISDIKGTISLKETGKYRLISNVHGIDKVVHIKYGENIDTLKTQRIFECLEPVSHPKFVGFCCCENKCNGFQQDFYYDGTLRIEGNFKNGLAVGKLKFYHQNGMVQEIREYNKKGVLRRTDYFDEQGNILEK